MQQQGRTGTSNEYYDLVSVMYHALHGAQTHQTYAQDAEQRGDQELAQFFRQVQQEDKNRADRAKQLLVSRLSQSGTGYSQTGMSGAQSTTR